MPFKQTPQWVNLALRRLMRYATENGFDRIAWTTGEQQVARYDLSKQIDEIEVEQGGKYKSWKYRLIINYNSGQKTSKLIDNDQELEDNVGKELAKKIIDDIAQGKSNFPAHGSNVYSGLDLKVGGEGMKAFYDAIIPAQANKVGKPFGASVEKTTLPDVGTVNSIPVTERMKEGAKAGFPLFSLERETPTHPTIHDAKIEALRDLSDKAQNARPTFVSGTYEDLMAQMGANNEPAAFIKAVLEQIAMGNKVQAFMGQHGVYFVAKNIQDAAQARKLWIHEQGTHVGLRLLS